MKAILKWKGLKQERQVDTPLVGVESDSVSLGSTSRPGSSTSSNKSRDGSPAKDAEDLRLSPKPCGTPCAQDRPAREEPRSLQIDEDARSNASSEANPGDPLETRLVEEEEIDVDGDMEPKDLSQRAERSERSDDEDCFRDHCDWCRERLGSNQFTMRNEADRKNRAFCSERCFSQYRRAAFKKSKVCDWCKKSPASEEQSSNGSRSISIADKSTQMHFCNENCLNQYKMDLFCREARAQLALLPDSLKNFMSDPTSSMAAKSAELWLAHQQAQIQERLRIQDQASKPNEAASNEPPAKLAKLSDVLMIQRQASTSSETATERPLTRKKPIVKVKPEHFLKHKSASSESRSIQSSSLRDHRPVRRRLHSPQTTTPRSKSPTGIATRIRKAPPNHQSSKLASQPPCGTPINGARTPPPLMMPHPRSNMDLRAMIHPLGPLPPPLTPAPSGPPTVGAVPPRPSLPSMASILPPPALMIPLPCFIPLPFPVPIPIPIPMSLFAKMSAKAPEVPPKSNGTGPVNVKVKCEVKEEASTQVPALSPVYHGTPSPSESGGEMDSSTELRRARRRALLMDIPSTNKKTLQKH